MNYEITKLDKRHAWHDQFQYLIEFKRASNSFFSRNNTGVLEFDRARKWFNDTYGWSQDVETRDSISKLQTSLKAPLDDYNVHWSYSIKYNEYRLYVATEQELNWFTLSHQKDNHGPQY